MVDSLYCTYLFKDVTKMESLKDGLSKHEMHVCMAARLITHFGQFIASWICIVHGNAYDFTQKSASISVQSLPHLTLVNLGIWFGSFSQLYCRTKNWTRE